VGLGFWKDTILPKLIDTGGFGVLETCMPTGKDTVLRTSIYEPQQKSAANGRAFLLLALSNAALRWI